MLIKDLRLFQQWSNMKIIPLITVVKNSQNSNDFLHSLVKSLKIKFYIRWEGPRKCCHSKWETSKSCKMISSTSNHENFSSRQHSEAVTRRCFIKKLSLIISKNSQKPRMLEPYFNRVARLTLIKIDSGTRVFL